jgi:lipopolysaccharide export system permease protein
MAIPLSALFATIYCLNKLSEDSEIVAMRSFGLTRIQIFAPFALLGLLIAGSIFSLNQNIIPYSKTQFKNTIIRLTSRGLLTNIKSEQFFTEIPGVTLFAEKVTKKGTRLEDVFIQVRNKSKSEEKIIFAKNGVLIKQKRKEWEAPTLRLHLTDGNIIKTFPKNSDVEKILFREYDFPILTGGFSPGFVTKDSMRTNSELRTVMKKEKAKLKNLEGLNQLSNAQQLSLNQIKKGLAKTEIEFWSRFNTPLQCLVFILLGFSLGIKKGRGNSRNTGAIGMIILTCYYVLFFLGVSLARKGVLPPIVVVFTPTVLSLGIGSWYYSKLDWFN